MSFDKEALKKIASEIKKDGVTLSASKELYKKAFDIKVAYLTAVIKRQYN